MGAVSDLESSNRAAAQIQPTELALLRYTLRITADLVAFKTVRLKPVSSQIRCTVAALSGRRASGRDRGYCQGEVRLAAESAHVGSGDGHALSRRRLDVEDIGVGTSFIRLQTQR